uniref:Uncharacterized protein n=1 Tax=Chromera velia CCMP2878 TaxID=1169474 RepID=A0A0G4G6J2_9ALVE|eukprot:Cvel_20400.t1-p1 / transcript=Cvel_20400.t1 / gene=Cvel_20400 / organism=Chromera_velia_CCMP2878 / gene_product=hypothetical protein / transcript_product=hypothetical protein / location=Cvel_scaffold1827:14055-16433(-) / protein_length=528 / sequence_SO=supercontig / SO=protein_coding / is_pseudo=false
MCYTGESATGQHQTQQPCEPAQKAIEHPSTHASDSATEPGTPRHEEQRPQEGTAECAAEGVCSFPFSKEATLAIFDWDDTVLPTTWLSENGLYAWLDESCTEPFPGDIEAQLSQLADSALSMLKEARRSGYVMFVTNADEGWVELSCRKYLPKLWEYLQAEPIRVVSARSTYERQGISSPFEWKLIAFENEISQYYANPYSFAAVSVPSGTDDAPRPTPANTNPNQTSEEYDSLCAASSAASPSDCPSASQSPAAASNTDCCVVPPTESNMVDTEMGGVWGEEAQQSSSSVAHPWGKVQDDQLTCADGEVAVLPSGSGDAEDTLMECSDCVGVVEGGQKADIEIGDADEDGETENDVASSTQSTLTDQLEVDDQIPIEDDSEDPSASSSLSSRVEGGVGSVQTDAETETQVDDAVEEMTVAEEAAEAETASTLPPSTPTTPFPLPPQSPSPPQILKRNIISVGDSNHEREALLRVCGEMTYDHVAKSIKFIERPDLGQLRKEQELIAGCFRQLALQQTPLDMCVRWDS